MKTKLNLAQARSFCALALGLASSFSLTAAAGDSAETAPVKTTQEARLVTSSPTIPWSQIGAKAGVDYQGDGLAVTATVEGARLRCVFQQLEGEVTREGLWLTSPVTNGVNDRFRVTAAAVGRLDGAFGVPALAGLGSESSPHTGSPMAWPAKAGTPNQPLPRTGTVQVADKLVRFSRPGLTEEYTVSMDGVRQDFVVLERPAGTGELTVRLAVNGAKVEPAAFGARLVLENSGRKIAYSRLRVTDATDKKLTARMEISDGRDAFHRVPTVAGGGQGRGGTRPYLVVVVNDANAIYPVRIDPTFSDANWISLNPNTPGINGLVLATAVDSSGNLDMGGQFTRVDDILVNRIARWNGSGWSALGSGMNGQVRALARAGSDIYAGGTFTYATNSGSVAVRVNHIAKWDGSSWSALGAGTDRSGFVYALAAAGSDLYAGGIIATAGGIAADYIAKWNGSGWSALGSGLGGTVFALAVSGSDVYAGGIFSSAGSGAAMNIAKWNGSSWSALGSGMNNYVWALAMSGSDVYAGGDFTTAGGNAATNIAKWNGSNWSALGSGMNGTVHALVLSGNDLYVGGSFTNAGGGSANHIAKWNGSDWYALGSGMNSNVWTLTLSGSDLYAGGNFTTAGGKVSAYIALAYLPALPELSVSNSGADVLVSWPSADTAGFALEQDGTLAAPANWVTNSASVTDDGTNKSVTVPATNGGQFFRLRRP